MIYSICPKCKEQMKDFICKKCGHIKTNSDLMKEFKDEFINYKDSQKE